MLRRFRFYLSASFVLFSLAAFSQDKCFENCLRNFENSTLAWPEKNERIVGDLVGCKAPDFWAKTISGETISLSSFRGRTVVLNFWFIGCAPCIAEMPALNALADEYKDDEVIFIAFAREDEVSLRKFLTKTEFKYKIVSEFYNVVDEYCLLGGWPTNMVIDKHGIVRKIFFGGYTDERAKTHAYTEMKPIIDESLSQKSR
jgi:peroxiredoxin